MKPIGIPQNAILNSSERGDLVGDLFAGAGSTMIACEMTGRVNYSMEIDPYYADVTIRRWQDFAHGIATLESTGQTFADVERERA
jgi:DNA modification methylase